jgi:tRNA nucleotidyltransferase (CCA-adding enzyme)
MKSTEIVTKIQRAARCIMEQNPLVRAIVDDIYAHGGSAYLVGGAVRDIVLEKSLKDLDIEVHGLTLEVVRNILAAYGHVDLVGKSFGVLRVHAIDADWSLPRADSSGRRPMVHIDPYMGIEAALRRRDLTMNAMALDLRTFQLIDPFGGLKDIGLRRLRTPDVKFFVEDPLRFYRVMQFVGRFEMLPDDELNDVCRKMVLKGLSRERISDEFEKLLLQASRPSLGLRWLVVIGRIRELLPELGALLDIGQDPIYHPEGSVFEHTMHVIDAAAHMEYGSKREKLVIMLAALCHDLGKAVCTQAHDGHITSLGHAQAGAALAKKLLARITLKKDLVAAVVKLIEYHMVPFLFIKDGAGPAAYKRLAKKLSPEVTIEMLAKLAEADRVGRGLQQDVLLSKSSEDCVGLFLKRARDALVATFPERALLKGRDFLDTVAPGRDLGACVARAYELQVELGIKDRDRLKKMVLDEYAQGLLT